MAFYSNQVLSQDGPSINLPSQSSSNNQSDELNKLELEYLLDLLKNTDLKGYQIELFYNLALKLQNQYLKKSK